MQERLVLLAYATYRHVFVCDVTAWRYIETCSSAGHEVSSKTVPYLRRLVVGFPSRWPGFEPGSGHVGCVVDKAALEQVSSEYFGFPCHSFHRLLNIIRGWYSRPIVAEV
jgi:hypothetical protein